jgi:putative FmdB family regulatory protein
MPLYRYECESCGNEFTVLVRQQGQDAPQVCPECGSVETRRMVSRVAVQFRGSGYYKTDYAHKGRGGTRDRGRANDGSSTSSTTGKDAGGAKEAASDSSSAPKKETVSSA